MSKAMSVLGVVLFVVVLVACGPSEPSESVIQTAIAQTEAARPAEPSSTAEQPSSTPRPSLTSIPTETPWSTDTPEPTRVLLSDLDLGSILFEPGDLPSHLSPTVVSTDELLTQNLYLDDVPFGVNFINQSFHNEDRGSTGGAVIVYVYDDPETAGAVYRKTSRVVDEKHSLLGMFTFEPSIGDRATGGSDTPQMHLTFQRCTTIVYIWMVDVTEDQIVACAQQLDRRLADLVCLTE